MHMNDVVSLVVHALLRPAAEGAGLRLAAIFHTKIPQTKILYVYIYMHIRIYMIISNDSDDNDNTC